MFDAFKKALFKLIPDEKQWELKNKYSIPSMEWSLLNLKRNHFAPTAIVDVGAYEGQWTVMIKRIFPEVIVLMLEAQEGKKSALEDVCRQFAPTVQMHLGLVGPDNRADAVFFENETVSSALPEHHATQARPVTVPMRTLDFLVESQHFPLPNLIKLDVQGYELEVLKGAGHALAVAEVVLMEVSLIDINQGAPTFYETIAFMDHHHFTPYDICSFIRRPLDKALWQTDIIFVRKTSPLVASKKWQ